MSTILNLEQYRIQRQKRKKVREQFIQKLSAFSKRKPSQQSQKPPTFEEEVGKLEQENKRLALELNSLQANQSKKIADFKQKFDKVRVLYMDKIREIINQGKKQKEDYRGKIIDVKLQTSTALQKTKELQGINQKLEQDFGKTEPQSEKYYNEIQKEYSGKLKQFEQVLNISNQKIQALESKMDNEELVEATLTNEELINQIRLSAQKSGEEVDRIYNDYVELLKAKQEIIIELRENNSMKEKEVANSAILESKLKAILQKLGQEREIYVDQNKKMTKELGEIQQILIRVMGTALE